MIRVTERTFLDYLGALDIGVDDAWDDLFEKVAYKV